MIEFEVLFTVSFIAFLLTVLYPTKQHIYLNMNIVLLSIPYDYASTSHPSSLPSIHLLLCPFFFCFPCHSPSSLLYHIYHALLLSFPSFPFLFNISYCLLSTTSWSENATNAMNSYCTEGAHSLEWANSIFCFVCFVSVCVSLSLFRIMFILTVVQPTIPCTQPSLDMQECHYALSSFLLFPEWANFPCLHSRCELHYIHLLFYISFL